MAQKRGAGRGVVNKPTPQQAIHDLKQRTIVAINKLADRDTYQIASAELDIIAHSLTADALGPFLSCLCDTDSRHKSIVRKECVKLLGTMADAHGDLMAPHVSKMVGSVVRRLKDPDSNIRDACVEAIGVMAAKIKNGLFPVFVRPLFESLGEQNRHLQAGSALCLAKFIDNVADPPAAGVLQKFLPRIIKLLNNQLFLGKPALLCVVGSIVNAGGVSTEQSLSMVVPSLEEALKSGEWATRKAAAEAFGRMGSSIGAPLAPFVPSCIASLESCRFDKVKPVRDAVNKALQTWKSIPDSNECLSSSERESSVKETKRKSDFSVSFKPSKADSVSVKKNNIAGSRSPPDTLSVNSIKKRTPLINAKTYPALLQKQDQRKIDNWQIEVAFPRNQRTHVISVEDQEKSYTPNFYAKGRDRRGSTGGQGSRYRDADLVERDDTPRRSDFQTKCVVIDDALEVKPAINATPSEKQQASSISDNTFKNQCNGHDANELTQIRKQLVQIENQQSSLLDLMKMFMGNSQDGMRSLETRVHGLERTVDEMAHDLAVSTGRLSNVEDGSVTCCKFPGSVFLSSKFWRKNEGRYSPVQLATSDVSSSSKFGRETPYRAETGTDVWDKKYKGVRGGFIVNPLADVQATIRKASPESISNNIQMPISKNLKRNQIFTRELEKSRNNEDPSVRSALQVSENETTTFSAIQVAMEDAKKDEPDVLKERSNPNVLNKKNENLFTSRLGYGNGSFWSVWTRAVDFLQKGDVDSAFMEVLCPGDDLLLIRLMNRTGPVLEHLSQGTILEMLQTIKQCLLKQKYLGAIVPWIQQVVELTASNGSDYLALPVDVKKDLLSALQEASSMQFSDASSRKTVAHITSKLSTLWSIDCR